MAFSPQTAQQKPFIYLGAILEGSRRPVKVEAPRLKKQWHDGKKIKLEKIQTLLANLRLFSHLPNQRDEER